ncbi:error-prone DNA polymerase [Novosphingobium sp.]|uniref:error-prone DNA polymerase n=1 Tax=Novosphingobium sp. TaxID=1874826 RepID=UPI0025F0A595|nr:error-prone DNA polymerase [Novosphingobium sp.]MCC6925805.1 error-prone DNA polymerase [Novosphingobium sp.]
MPESPLTPERRRAGEAAAPPPRAAFVELGWTSCFSFLRGASDAVDFATQARALGYDAVGIADANTMAGVVRLHSEATALKLRPVIGCRIETVEGLAFLAYPADRQAYGRLCRLISAGRMGKLDGEWQDKGACDVSLAMLAAHSEGVHLVLVPPDDLDAQLTIAVESNVVDFLREGAEARRCSACGEAAFDSSVAASGNVNAEEIACGAAPPLHVFVSSCVPDPDPLRASAPPRETILNAPFPTLLPHIVRQFPTLRCLAASYLYRGDDLARIARLDVLAGEHGLELLATNLPLYHAPHRRPLHDVMTAIRRKTTVAAAGHLLEANAERHLKGPEEMARLFADWPHALGNARKLADSCQFSLEELRYEYPRQTYPDGLDAQAYLERLTWQGATGHYPQGTPHEVAETLRKELAMIAKKNLAQYFLTIKEVVDFARSRQPPILCQGRGSAANSAVCFCLGITSVNPVEHALLFERFISEDRDEPPDIDVDFEHERREEVIQHIYQRYGRHHAGLCATVIHYRPRMAIREVGKAMGLSEDVTAALAKTVWGGHGRSIKEHHIDTETGLDSTQPHLQRVLKLTEQLIGMPRHLSQHVGGFILTEGPLSETVPIGNGAMPDRSFIEWDKDDIDALGILKVDVLALGMLTCIRKCLDLLRQHHGRDLTLATVPREDPAVYDMLCRGDSLGVFQVESRAQMNMLPRLRPRCFYDLVIEVAIVRPGPIQGDMVHPFLKRRRGAEKVEIPAPGPAHGPPDELTSILGRTLGVPIFQEQAMKIALDAAQFSSREANRLRKAMATFRSRGNLEELEELMVGRMVARGYDPDFAMRCFNQIKGFGEYGFPESHAASFALLVYVSSWLKCHYPAAFAAALLNSQPMGFYAPAQIVRDARAHGVLVLPPDVNCSMWDNTLEPSDSRGNAETRREEERDSCRKGAKARRDGSGGEALSKFGALCSGQVQAVDNACSAEQPLRAFAPLREQPSSLRVSASPRAPELALRLGLRQVDGLAEAAAARLIAGRETGPYRDVTELKDRAGLSPAVIERLASADCFNSLGLTRRQALWDARSVIAAPDLPLFAAAQARDEGTERTATRLPAMPLSEEVVADYQTQRLSLKAHPLAFLRASLGDRGFIRAEELARHSSSRPVQVAGVVLIRQRPGSAKGVCFITIEDESGVANVVVWPDVMEKQRKVIMGARLLEVRGRVEQDDGVIHVIAQQLTDATAALHALSDDLLPHHVDRADHVLRPNQGSRGGHPRDARVIPKSRDFH